MERISLTPKWRDAIGDLAVDNAEAKFGVFQATLDHAAITDEFKSDFTDKEITQLAAAIAYFLALKYPDASHAFHAQVGQGMMFGAMAWSMTRYVGEG